MIAVTEEDAATIRATLERDGELSAAVEVRRKFKALSVAQAREWVHIIAAWQPLPGADKPTADKVVPLKRGKR